MPIGDMPILELLIRRLKRVGVEHIDLAVGHLASLLMAYFGDGSPLGVNIEYSLEKDPLGTAGPLGLIEGLEDTFFVMNGDLLTDLNFTALAETHYDSGAAATIGLFRRSVKIDLGVVETGPDGSVTRYIEKPVNDYQVSMGVYVMEPEILRVIPKHERFDLPELITALLASGTRVATHQHPGYWLDIGRPDDYQQAQTDFESIRARLLGDDSDPAQPVDGAARD
jgi:NDP-sugar pyrophosphorylase family protein